MVFSPRLYARAGNSYMYGLMSVSVCLSVTLSVCHKSVFYRNGWTDRAGFWHVCFFQAVLYTLWRKEIQVSTKIRVLPPGTLCQSPILETFASAYRSSKRVINLARERWTLRA